MLLMVALLLRLRDVVFLPPRLVCKIFHVCRRRDGPPAARLLFSTFWKGRKRGLPAITGKGYGVLYLLVGGIIP